MGTILILCKVGTLFYFYIFQMALDQADGQAGALEASYAMKERGTGAEQTRPTPAVTTAHSTSTGACSLAEGGWVLLMLGRRKKEDAPHHITSHGPPGVCSERRRGGVLFRLAAQHERQLLALDRGHGIVKLVGQDVVAERLVLQGCEVGIGPG